MRKFFAFFVFAILSTISVMAKSGNLIASLAFEEETTHIYYLEALAKPMSFPSIVQLFRN